MEAIAAREGTGLHVIGTKRLSLKESGIEAPKFMLGTMSVSDPVDVHFDFHLQTTPDLARAQAGARRFAASTNLLKTLSQTPGGGPPLHKQSCALARTTDGKMDFLRHSLPYLGKCYAGEQVRIGTINAGLLFLWEVSHARQARAQGPRGSCGFAGRIREFLMTNVTQNVETSLTEGGSILVVTTSRSCCALVFAP